MERKEINSQIGARIKVQRERAGLTQEKFGELVGLESKTVSAVERGVVGISLVTLKNICTVLSISSDTLLFETSAENNVEFLTERLKRLTPKQFSIIEGVMQKVMEAFVSQDD